MTALSENEPDQRSCGCSSVSGLLGAHCTHSLACHIAASTVRSVLFPCHCTSLFLNTSRRNAGARHLEDGSSTALEFAGQYVRARITDDTSDGDDGADALSENHPFMGNHILLLLGCLHTIQQTRTDSAYVKSKHTGNKSVSSPFREIDGCGAHCTQSAHTDLALLRGLNPLALLGGIVHGHFKDFALLFPADLKFTCCVDSSVSSRASSRASSSGLSILLSICEERQIHRAGCIL